MSNSKSPDVTIELRNKNKALLDTGARTSASVQWIHCQNVYRRSFSSLSFALVSSFSVSTCHFESGLEGVEQRGCFGLTLNANFGRHFGLGLGLDSLHPSFSRLSKWRLFLGRKCVLLGAYERCLRRKDLS